MMTGVARVLGRAGSINVRKVLWTGIELGLDLRREEVDVTDPAFRALNPNAMMPVLVEDSGGAAPFVLWESNVICRYLASRAGREDLLPSDPRRRAPVEMWMDWQASELNNSWRYAFMSVVRHSPAHQDPAQREAGVASWNRHMAILDGQLARSGGPFVLGTTFSLADVVLGLSAHRWRTAPIAHAALPAVDAWLRHLDQRPGFIAQGREAGP